MVKPSGILGVEAKVKAVVRHEPCSKIWGRKNSINVQKVMWTVGELGLEPERIDAGMRTASSTSPGMRPTIPTAWCRPSTTTASVLWESNVIVRYLAASTRRAR